MIKELSQDISLNKISHAYFFECDNEKIAIDEASLFAEIILKRKINNNPDCIFVTTEEKSIKVDQIREIQKDIAVKPIYSDRKVYIIPEANKLNIAAQNCLLKTLEEPPIYAVLILIAPSIYSVIGTVRSRVKCIKIYTEEDIDVRKEVRELLDTLKYKNHVEVLKYADFFDKNKNDVIEILHEMLLYCNKRMLDAENKLSGEHIYDTITYAKYVPIISLAEKRLNENSNFSMTIDEMLLNMRG